MAANLGHQAPGVATLVSSLPLRLGKLSFKNEQSPADKYSEIVQRWKDEAAFHGHTTSEKYAYGRIALICDLHASFTSRNHQSASLGNGPLGNRGFFASFVYVADIANPLELQVGNDKPMFVHNVETVKLPDAVTIPSLVGLYRLHDVVAHPFRGLTFQSALDEFFKVIPCLVHRKGHILRPLASDQEFDLTHGNVESTPKVVDGIANDTHKLRGNGLTRDEFERIASRIRITVDTDSVSMITDELMDVGLEISDVLCGPFDL